MSVYLENQKLIIETVESIKSGNFDSEKILTVIQMLLYRMEYAQKKKIDVPMLLEKYFKEISSSNQIEFWTYI